MLILCIRSTTGNTSWFFCHIDFPEAGIQVTGGTVEPGELLQAAVLRQAIEETDLNDLLLVEKLGTVKKDMRPFGMDNIHLRHYFHFALDSEPQTSWLAYEQTPSDGNEVPISLRFFWVPVDQVPGLAGGLDEMLECLRESLK